MYTKNGHWIEREPRWRPAEYRRIASDINEYNMTKEAALDYARALASAIGYGAKNRAKLLKMVAALFN